MNVVVMKTVFSSVIAATSSSVSFQRRNMNTKATQHSRITGVSVYASASAAPICPRSLRSGVRWSANHTATWWSRWASQPPSQTCTIRYPTPVAIGTRMR